MKDCHFFYHVITFEMYKQNIMISMNRTKVRGNDRKVNTTKVNNNL